MLQKISQQPQKINPLVSSLSSLYLENLRYATDNQLGLNSIRDEIDSRNKIMQNNIAANVRNYRFYGCIPH